MGALLARLRALTGNRWAMAGLAGAAGLGAVALARSRGGGTSALGAGSGGTEEAGEAAGTAFTGQAFPDTSATDLATAVGGLDEKWAAELADYTAAAAANQASLDALTKQNAKQQTTINSIAAKVAAMQPKPAPKASKPKTSKPKVGTTKTPSGWKTITIKRGDTLSAIARRYHTTVATLSKRNKITDPNRIRAGAKLLVPA